MLLENVKLPAIQPFTSRYIEEDQLVRSLFHSGYREQEVFTERVKEVQARSFERDTLVHCIKNYMADLPQSKAVERSLKALGEDALVVIGGQQAGLLTGPLYTIHKVLSIIHLAKQQETKLGVPIVPVFWIAGEDHDFLEVNHVYVEKQHQMVKKGYPERVLDKRMTTEIEYDETIMKKWVRSVFKDFGETSYTNSLINKLDTAIEQSSTIVQFFSYLVMDLFKDEGLLVIDAADSALRELERPFFLQLLNENRQITQLVLQQQAQIQQLGFKPMIDLSSNAANLFITIDHERILLENTSEGYQDKNGFYFFSHEELHALIEEKPWMFSNNVVTRPMMQEWVFPTLSFIAGPGEIAYWAELKTAFEHMGMNMPPVVPRLNITIVERDVSQKINDLGLKLSSVLEHGVMKEREQYWNHVKDETMDILIKEAEEWIHSHYLKISKHAEGLHPGLPPIVKRNLEIHTDQLAYLGKKSNDHIAIKHEVTLSKYDRIASSLRPGNGPQERVWNMYYFLNRYGDEFLKQLVEKEYDFGGDHKVLVL
ncbi:bacillithiol biosynthesis cysteine-adding enzyme BshC [Jeotgalibacillus soli]|uniref:Putative cysteine ligase BshC n=1 Tax=Jeotgalibacillus soli TaxID=889306 RepID=A0A0C2VJX8_9BACL|nr:bacillithiol biosynthesis cysteine-adding enzyme BshC [Jeotgalibacillus soli]KIL44786.1 hypothetical protein KP78_23300 [Jeotgalibacillus soli]